MQMHHYGVLLSMLKSEASWQGWQGGERCAVCQAGSSFFAGSCTALGPRACHSRRIAKQHLPAMLEMWSWHVEVAQYLKRRPFWPRTPSLTITGAIHPNGQIIYTPPPPPQPPPPPHPPTPNIACPVSTLCLFLAIFWKQHRRTHLWCLEYCETKGCIS